MVCWPELQLLCFLVEQVVGWTVGFITLGWGVLLPSSSACTECLCLVEMGSAEAWWGLGGGLGTWEIGWEVCLRWSSGLTYCPSLSPSLSGAFS